MCQEAYLAGKATNTFDRYHHASACLYFGVGAIEAFLNKKIRERFAGAKSEEDLLKMLRVTALMKKVNEWPSVLCGVQISVPSELVAALDDFRLLRGEVTHQKRRDHSLFSDLDVTKPQVLVDAVSRYQIVILEHLKQTFPYWLLGWNYVGLNNDPEAPCLLNNQQFRYSLCALGEKVPATDYDAATEWECTHMTSWSGFLQLKATLDGKSVDIEPLNSRLPMKPRLTRIWWDPSLRIS